MLKIASSLVLPLEDDESCVEEKALGNVFMNLNQFFAFMKG
jgi:hypothetical protein